MTSSTAFKIVPLGVGDAFSELYYSSGFWLEYDGCRVLVDCAHPIRKSMREASIQSGCDINVSSLDAVILTHLHADHASGLEGLGFYAYYVARKSVTLLAHEDVMRDIWPRHLEAVMAPVCDPPEEQRQFDDFFKSQVMAEDVKNSFGPFLIECRRTLHHVPTFALRITAGERVFGYSADTSFDESLIDWLSQADVFAHETNGGSHTPYEKLAALPEAVRAKMRLIHYPDNFNKAESVITPLEQGELIVL